MSRATTLASVNQQLAIAAGVAAGAFILEATLALRHTEQLTAADFWPAFLAVALISFSSIWAFYKLPANAGYQVSGQKATTLEGPKAAVAIANESTGGSRDQRL